MNGSLMLSTNQESLLIDTLGAMSQGPRVLESTLKSLADETHLVPTHAHLSDHLIACAQDNPAVNRFRASLVAWDASDAPWTQATPRNTRERRERIYNLLGISGALQRTLEERLPFAMWDRPVLIAT